MIPFPSSLLGILLGTLIPAYVGLFGAVLVGGHRPQYLAALSIGILLWFFSDTLGGSSYLGVNEGLSGGGGHIALVVLFIVAPIAFFALEGSTSSRQRSSGGAALSGSPLVPVLVAIALSIHGLGEGVGYASVTSLASSSSIVEAFGGYAPAASYVLHKFLEPVAIGASYSGFCLRRSPDREGERTGWGSLALIGAIFVVPTLLGTVVGYYSPVDTTYFFALGAGASVYVIFKLVQVLFEVSDPFDSYRESMKVVLLALVGFVLIYAAAVFHSVV